MQSKILLSTLCSSLLISCVMADELNQSGGGGGGL